MCSIFSTLSAIFALFLSLAQAKHQFIRIYPFASGDCNGPPIYGEIDLPRDACRSLPFGGSSIRLTETTLGDWTREINKGATGCYFYAYTQFGCYERYLDIIIDPGDAMNLCIPSRDANDPIFSVSFTCVFGEPPRRRWALPAAANRTADALNMTSPDVASAYLHGRAVVDELRKSNGTTRFNSSVASGAAQNGCNDTSITIDSGNSSANGIAQNTSARSVNNHRWAFINGERNANDSSPVNARSVNFHGPALINGKPNFNSSHELTKRELDDEPSIVSGILDFNSTHKFINSKSESPVEPIGARFVNRHGPAFIDEEPKFNSSRAYKDSESDYHVQLGNNTTEQHELAGVNRVPITNGTRSYVHSAGTPIITDSDKSFDYYDDDFGWSDSDSDWSDSDFDDNRDEYESYRNSTSFGNSTSLDKREILRFFYEGPRMALWMLHPWTGGLLCYNCFAKAPDQLTRFQCRWGYKVQYHGDCGEKPLAPIYTKTITVQPIVTVTPLPGQPSIQKHSLQKRSWHMPVLLQNPWYPGITVCSIAEWEGRGKRKNQSIKIEKMHKKLYKCDKSPIAQNIMVWERTATYTMPVKTVSVIPQQPAQTIIKTVIPPPVTMISTVDAPAPYDFTTTGTVTSFGPILVSTSTVAPSEPTVSAAIPVPIAISVPTASASISVLRASDFRPVPSTSVDTVHPTIEPTTVSRLPMASYVEPADYYTSAVVGLRPIDTSKTKSEPEDYYTSAVLGLRPTDTTEPTSEPTYQPQPRHMYVDARVGGFSTVIVPRNSDTL